MTPPRLVPREKQTVLAALPPLTSKPPALGDTPTSSAIHRTVCSSISVAAGASVHNPTLGFSADARKSPKMPIGAGGAVMYPKKRGCALKSE